MVTINYISVALGIFCIVVSLVVLVASVAKSERRLLLNRLFSGIIICNIGIVSSDVVAWLMTGNTERYAYYLIRAANFLHYMFGALVLTTLTLYMLAYAEIKIRVPRKVITTVISICVLSLVLTVVSQFTGMYYTIDENNVYHRGQLFLLSQLLPLIGLAINVSIVIIYRKAFGRKASLFFFTYMILPITALFIQMMFYGITFINIGTTLTTLILYIGVQSERERDMATRIMLAEQQLELQSEHYKTLRTHIEETKRAEHDLRHHLATIQSYTAARENEKLDEYLSKYVESLPYKTEIIFCENSAVNSILYYYVNMAKSEGIQVDASLDISSDTSICDSDLCIIFGNCIGNAIEACRKLSGEKFIKIRSKLTGNMLTIIIANSFDGNIKKDDDNFLSLKAEGGGIGISSVKAVVEKYGESVQFETNGNVFRVTVILRAVKLDDISL